MEANLNCQLILLYFLVLCFFVCFSCGATVYKSVCLCFHQQTGTGKTLAFLLPAFLHIDGQET